MPYHGEDISMFIILPQKVDGLKKVGQILSHIFVKKNKNKTKNTEKKAHSRCVKVFQINHQLETELNYDTFMKWTLKRMGNVVVQVKIPKFKLEEKYSLKTVLSSMGMVDAFTQSRSNFTGRTLDGFHT